MSQPSQHRRPRHGLLAATPGLPLVIFLVLLTFGVMVAGALPVHARGERLALRSATSAGAALAPATGYADPAGSARPPESRVVAPRVANRGVAPIRKPGAGNPEPSTAHAIVVDGASGAVLFQRNAFEPVAPASTTKIMTAILGLEHGRLDERVDLDVDAGSMPGSSLMGLEPWFEVTMRDLLYGLILVSGNDAALAIAQHVAGNEAAFVRLMNEKAAWLGLQATHFANPHGLDTTDHYSSPYDMAVMARYGMQYEEFRQIAAARQYSVRSSNLNLSFGNVNPILGAVPEANGIKTGLTDSAGRSLVASARRGTHKVFVAFMRSDAGTAYDGTLLLNWAFDSFLWDGDALALAR